MIDVRTLVGQCDILLVTLDTLRYDVAQTLAAAGRTPNLSGVLPAGRWEERHSPGSFTYSAHHALFAGFFPTPACPGKWPRPFALSFPGSETVGEKTCVLDAPNLVAGLSALGYRTVCIGGVGFFNRLSPLGRVLPDLFDESHWTPELGVTDPRSTEHQVTLAMEILRKLSATQRVFLFVNVSAIHQPNCCYVDGALTDTLETHAAALEYVDRSLGVLLTAMKQRGACLCVICSDHGTAYGEDGFEGHRLAHPVVWTVPYAEFVLREDRP